MMSVAVETHQNTTQEFCTNCFKSLGVETKHKIYMLLKEQGAKTVTQITDFVELKQPTVSYHLKDMEENGLVIGKRTGKEVHYDVNYKCPHYERDCIFKEIKFS